MRIAQVSPLYESVPPALYGGTERVVHTLTESLIDAGHDVTLFASGDSQTRARLRAPIPRALRLENFKRDPLACHLLLLEMVMDEAADFDMIHFHTDLMHLPMTRQIPTASVTTLHGRLDLPDVIAYHGRYCEHPVVSISRSQREPLPDANWVATIHHGLPTDRLKFSRGDGGYLAFLGRLSREKRFDRAVRIAQRAGLPLKVAAKREDSHDADYVSQIEPLLRQKEVEFVGEINDSQKSEFLGRARATLFPIDWPEPFGLVMIESLACGTPVIAYPHGSVPEIIQDGFNGFVVDSIHGAVEAVRRIGEIDRRKCREDFQNRFSQERMTEQYVRLYDRLRLSRATAPSFIRSSRPMPATHPTERWNGRRL
ncbi:MAG: glycosyltransferase family 4 protein [Bdellovibrionaceae bacterium]|nr:glycosyltransferase family 4 protein [Pseudobdellovibrionaceae bacterium]